MNTRADRILAVTLAGLLLLAVVAAILSVTRDRAPYPEGTPEATVQAYVEAAVAGDGQAAVTYLDPAGGCTAQHVEEGWISPGVRVVLRESSTDGERATARVDVVSGSGGLLGASEWSEEQTFELRLVEGRWLITGAPWPAYACELEGDRP